jgi:pyruvate/2-oxoglutarate/acetoin dehydrogenase E1 component
MSKKPYAYAVLEGIAQEMRANPNMCLFYQGALALQVLPTGEVLDLATEFGMPRTSGQGWMIDEAWYVGCGVGIAMTGVPVVVRMPSMTTVFPMEFMFQQVGKLRYVTGGAASLPLVIWFDGAGRGSGSGAQHNDVGLESMYANIPGLKVVAPSNAYDAKGLMVAAIRDPDPVAFHDYRGVAAGEQPDVPDEAYEVPFGEAVVRQEGTDLTIVAWAPATIEVDLALPDIAKEGISAEYIDPRTIKPLDVDTLVASVEKTGRLLVVDHGYYTNSFGSHVLAEVTQKVPGAKAKKIAFPDAWVPAAKDEVAWMVPDAPKIVDAAKKIMAL